MRGPEKLLAELIALPSVNPSFVPAGDARAGEGRVGDFLAATLASAGLAIEFQEVFPGRSNLLATLTPSGSVRQRVLLAPHMDTVPGVEGQFEPVKKGGRLSGRGACDTKGSVAAMATALMRLARHSARPKHTEVVFAGLVDEEDAQSGSRALVRSGFAADLAIVGEPTRLRAVSAHKGDLWLKIETTGKAAHGAKPHLGRNAVHAMARIVDWLETAYAAELRTRQHPLLGHPTVNVGAIHGGRQPNIVPDHCEIAIDRRTIPGETEATVCAEIHRHLRRHARTARLVNTKSGDCLPMETNAKLPLVRQFFGAAGQRRPCGVDFFCDASILSAGGIPSIIFGPGDIAQAHTVDEWIALESLDRATSILERFLLSLP